MLATLLATLFKNAKKSVAKSVAKIGPATLCFETKSVVATLFTLKSVAKTNVDCQRFIYVCTLLATLLHFGFGFFMYAQ